MTTLYGIKTCDTVRKARRWLEAKGVDYRYHDLREDGLDRTRLRRWAEAVGWEALLNRRSTTWKGLPPAEREALDDERTLELLLDHPTLIKRPVLELDDHSVRVGFSEKIYKPLFG